MQKETETFHGLKLLAHCGGGAFGDVYYCEDISGQRMAVKIVSKKKLGDSWARELKGVVNYRKITENASELLQIFHVGEDEEHFYYTMEAADSLPGQEYRPDTLAGRLTRGPLSQDEVFPVLSAIFSGIRTIHEAGFAHRDIKPDNILFVKGVPKLGDIGLTASTNSMTTLFAGTIDFLPPEVRTSGGTGSSDRRSTQRNDLYAFGKVVYCSVTARGPQAWPTRRNFRCPFPSSCFSGFRSGSATRTRRGGSAASTNWEKSCPKSDANSNPGKRSGTGPRTSRRLFC